MAVKAPTVSLKAAAPDVANWNWPPLRVMLALFPIRFVLLAVLVLSSFRVAPWFTVKPLLDAAAPAAPVSDKVPVLITVLPV